MRAWRCDRWGGPQALRLGELPDIPACPPGQVEIAVEAWGVNFADLVLIAGHYQARPAFPFAPGMEVAGRIVAVGDAQPAHGIGERVAAYVEYGGYAERVLAPVANVARLDPSVETAVAAGFPVPYGTARLALERGSLAAGETVLVGGAAGAVGLACVELARLRGARVIACVGSAEKADAAMGAGASATISSRAPDLRAEIGAAAPEGVDVVMDPIGGAFFEAAFRSLRYGGRHVVLGFAAGEIPAAPANRILVRHLSVIGSSFGLTCKQDPRRVADAWPELSALLAKGALRPRLDRVLPFSALPEALRLLEARQVAGRIVLEG